MTSRIFIRAMAAGLALTLGLAAAATGDERFPVRSEDDAGQPIANRVAAVDNVLAPLADRLARIGLTVPPGPPDEPLAAALVDLVNAADLLAMHTAQFCTGPLEAPTDTNATSGATIADDDRFATDASASGLANQAAAIAIVLGTADARMVRIADAWYQPPNPDMPPGPPNAPLLTELFMVYADAVDLAFAGAELLGTTYQPPNPDNPCAGDVVGP